MYCLRIMMSCHRNTFGNTDPLSGELSGSAADRTSNAGFDVSLLLTWVGFRAIPNEWWNEMSQLILRWRHLYGWWLKHYTPWRGMGCLLNVLYLVLVNVSILKSSFRYSSWRIQWIQDYLFPWSTPSYLFCELITKMTYLSSNFWEVTCHL